MRRVVPCFLLTLLLIGTFALAFNVGLVRAQYERVYIARARAAPILSLDNFTFTLTGNINYPTYNGIHRGTPTQT